MNVSCCLNNFYLEKDFCFSPLLKPQIYDGTNISSSSSISTTLVLCPPKKIVKHITISMMEKNGTKEKMSMSAGFYKRALPSPPAIDFTSSEGKVSCFFYFFIIYKISEELKCFILFLGYVSSNKQFGSNL